MSTKIPSRDHCKVFHLQPRASVSVRLRDVVAVTISGTGGTLDSGPWLTLVCHPLVSYHRRYSPFQNINLPFNILVTHLLQFGRPHVWQNSLFQHATYTTLQLTRTMHIGAFLSFKIYQTEVFVCATKLWWDLPFCKCFEREVKALKQSRGMGF